MWLVVSFGNHRNLEPNSDPTTHTTNVLPSNLTLQLGQNFGIVGGPQETATGISTLMLTKPKTEPGSGFLISHSSVACHGSEQRTTCSRLEDLFRTGPVCLTHLRQPCLTLHHDASPVSQCSNPERVGVGERETGSHEHRLVQAPCVSWHSFELLLLFLHSARAGIAGLCHQVKFYSRLGAAC